MQATYLDNDNESLIINIGNGHILPEGGYMFIEYYCDILECDCSSGLFQLTQLDHEGRETSNAIAMIYYTWAKPISELNPALEHQFLGSKLAEAGLDEFRKLLANDSSMTSKLKSAYDRTREEATSTQYPQTTTIRNANKIGRNDPCSCGSGKKYKKCCL